MTSIRPKPIEASSRNHQGGEHSKAPRSSQLQSEKSSSAALEQPTLDIVSVDLMEQIMDSENVETAGAKVRANRGATMTSRLQDLERHFNGWLAYFRSVPIKNTFSDLDKWVRRRIRACYWKQWRKPKTRVRKLASLEVDHENAYSQP